MTTNELKHAIGTFATRKDAEYALGELQKAGFDMDRVSVIAQNSETTDSMSGARSN